MTVNDGEVCVRWNKQFDQYRINQSRDNLGEYRRRRKGRVKEVGFNYLRKREVGRSETGDFNIGQGVSEHRDIQHTWIVPTHYCYSYLNICCFIHRCQPMGLQIGLQPWHLCNSLWQGFLFKFIYSTVVPPIVAEFCQSVNVEIFIKKLI